MPLSAAKSFHFGTANKILLTTTLVTGTCTVFASQSVNYLDDHLLGTVFIVALLHFVLAAWYCCFVNHRTRRIILATGLIALLSFTALCWRPVSYAREQNALVGNYMYQEAIR